MGRYDAKYSDDQREAVINAITADGLTAREAVELAAAGDLGVPAFDMAESTARGLLSRARQRQTEADVCQLERDEPGEGTKLLDRCMGVLEVEIGRIEELQRSGGELDSTGLQRVRWITRSVHEIHKVRKALARDARTRQAAKAGAEPDPEDSPLIISMLEEHQNGTNGNGAGQHDDG